MNSRVVCPLDVSSGIFKSCMTKDTSELPKDMFFSLLPVDWHTLPRTARSCGESCTNGSSFKSSSKRSEFDSVHFDFTNARETLVPLRRVLMPQPAVATCNVVHCHKDALATSAVRLETLPKVLPSGTRTRLHRGTHMFNFNAISMHWPSTTVTVCCLLSLLDLSNPAPLRGCHRPASSTMS